MSKILVANWKINPSTELEAVELAKATDYENVVITPPFPFLKSVEQTIKKARLGAQNVFWKESGAYTGEVSALMLKSLGVRYLIIGHSERRALGETDLVINKKVKVAFQSGLKVILCVGENAVVRKRGLSHAKNFVKRQLIQSLKNISSKTFKGKIVIAYEPIWAIGTGNSDQPADTQKMVIFIKNLLAPKIKKVPVLYGGSVTVKNARNFLTIKEVDGALVGGASLRKDEFRKIIKLANV